MDALSCILGSCCLLLVAAGAAKTARPQAAADLLGTLTGRSARRAARAATRLLGCAEAFLGATAFLLGGRAAAIMIALLYAAFAAVALRALVVGAESCGCFGRVQASPSRVSVTGNLMIAAFCGAVAAMGDIVSPVAVISASVGDAPLIAVALAAQTVVIAGLAFVAFTALPDALRSGVGADSSALFRLRTPPGASEHNKAVRSGSSAMPGVGAVSPGPL